MERRFMRAPFGENCGFSFFQVEPPAAAHGITSRVVKTTKNSVFFARIPGPRGCVYFRSRFRPGKRRKPDGHPAGAGLCGFCGFSRWRCFAGRPLFVQFGQVLEGIVGFLRIGGSIQFFQGHPFDGKNVFVDGVQPSRAKFRKSGPARNLERPFQPVGDEVRPAGAGAVQSE